MIIRTMKLKDLKAAPYNPRQKLEPGSSMYESLSRSIVEFGYVDPIIVNSRTGHVVGGNQRLQVLLDKGVTEAEVSMVDMDLEAEMALNIALNHAEGDWDTGSLQRVLMEIDTSPLSIEVTGFTIDEARSIIDGKQETASPVPTQEQINNRAVAIERQQATKSADVQARYMDVMCPHCRHEFALDTENALKEAT